LSFTLPDWDGLFVTLRGRNRISKEDYESWRTLSDLRWKAIDEHSKNGSDSPRSKKLSQEITALMMKVDEVTLKKKAALAFYGFSYPDSESAVILAFGKYCQFKDVYFDKLTVRTTYPDCLVTVNGEVLRIEFEQRSRHFSLQKHNPEKCDLIVCWRHDWNDCPLDVFEISTLNLFTTRLSKRTAEKFLGVLSV
jgi:hypothetical protein